jgi:osmotically-inducible protein OsmY
MTDHRESNTRTHTADTRNPEWPQYKPEGQGRTDEQIRADVHEALFGTEPKQDAELSLSVADGCVTLRGRVGAGEKDRIIERVRSVPSVKDVRSELEAS